MIMSFYPAIVIAILFSLQSCLCDNVVVAIKDEKIGLPCRHSYPVHDILKIWWQVDDVQSPAVAYQPGAAFPLAVYNDKYNGRVDIDFPSGNLMLKPVKLEDAGTYKCFITLLGGGVNGAESYRLHVNVVPKSVVVKCSDSKTSTPDRPCSGLKSISSISCSVASSPKSKVVWTMKPPGCNEYESNYCIVGSEPFDCVSQLEDVCDGTYACQAEYVNKVLDRTDTLPVVEVTINGKAAAGSTMEDNTDTWKIALITIIVIVLLAVVIVCVSILLAKRYCLHPGQSHHGRPPPKSCYEAIYAPCHCIKKSDDDVGSPSSSGKNHHHRSVPTERIPLNVNEPHRSTSDHDSSEEDNLPSNSITERKKVRPEILQAIEAAKSLAEAPAASRVNFMVTTIGGTKYKFDIEKEAKPSNSRSGSMDNFDAAGGSGADRETKTRSIKGPLEGQQRPKPKIEVDEVD